MNSTEIKVGTIVGNEQRSGLRSAYRVTRVSTVNAWATRLDESGEPTLIEIKVNLRTGTAGNGYVGPINETLEELLQHNREVNAALAAKKDARALAARQRLEAAREANKGGDWERVTPFHSSGVGRATLRTAKGDKIYVQFTYEEKRSAHFVEREFADSFYYAVSITSVYFDEHYPDWQERRSRVDEASVWDALMQNIADWN
jgi:hypothetical protein